MTTFCISICTSIFFFFRKKENTDSQWACTHTTWDNQSPVLPWLAVFGFYLRTNVTWVFRCATFRQRGECVESANGAVITFTRLCKSTIKGSTSIRHIQCVPASPHRRAHILFNLDMLCASLAWHISSMRWRRLVPESGVQNGKFYLWANDTHSCRCLFVEIIKSCVCTCIEDKAGLSWLFVSFRQMRISESVRDVIMAPPRVFCSKRMTDFSVSQFIFNGI